jgi:hypothetical protein
MRPINVTLDSVTWEYAKEKPNFSAWVRAQLRSERNKRETYKIKETNRECVLQCGRPRLNNDTMFCINHQGYGEEE